MFSFYLMSRIAEYVMGAGGIGALILFLLSLKIANGIIRALVKIAVIILLIGVAIYIIAKLGLIVF